MSAVSSSTSSSVSSYFQDIIAQREKLQAERITQGRSSGQLTQAEADRLDKSQARIAQLDQKAQADGSISGSEFAQIMHSQDRASNRIYSLKHNSITASGANTQGAGALASNAQISTVSNAQISAASNASTLGTTIWGEMNKLFQDIAQGLVQDRQTRLDQRIQTGIDSGQLTSAEQQKLQNLETQSNTLTNKAMTDGTLSTGDFMQAIQAQNMLSRQIFLYRNNLQSTDPAMTVGAASTTATTATSAAPPPPDYKPFSVSV